MKKNKMLRRKGSLTIELVLIFPVLMLLFFLFFQVSVMLVTYQSLQTTVSHAALAATTASSLDEITTVVNAGAANWYYSPEGSRLSPVTNAAAWNAGNGLKFRILVQDGAGWRYAAVMPAPGTNMMVEIKLTEMKTKFPNLWLMPQFKGVDADSDSFVVSAMGRRQ